MRTRSRSTGLALAACLVVVGCAAQQPSTSASPRGADALRAQIEREAARFSETFNRGDVAALAAMYDTGAVVLAPNAPPMRGRQNI